jgi:hypothetical protein
MRLPVAPKSEAPGKSPPPFGWALSRPVGPGGSETCLFILWEKEGLQGAMALIGSMPIQARWDGS